MKVVLKFLSTLVLLASFANADVIQYDNERYVQNMPHF